MFHQLPFRCARRAAALNGVPVVSLLTPRYRQRSRLALQSETVLAFVRPSTSVNAPLDWCKTAWEVTARSLLLPGKVQNAISLFRQQSWGHRGHLRCPTPSLLVSMEKGMRWAPRCPVAASLQSPLPLVGPPIAMHAAHTPSTHWRHGRSDAPGPSPWDGAAGPAGLAGQWQGDREQRCRSPGVQGCR